ncbi:MAG: S9 family peptidase, partial [Pyrinomonadaceae bacterium]|nr:S9 family peptidase [Pyrinomonadaceae bacterium]
MFAYPNAPKINQVDDYHGTKVADPFRPLEDPDAPESRVWIEAQNKLTFDYLATIPQRDAIKQRITKLFNYEKFSAPFKEGKRYFYFKNDGLQNQSVLYVADSIEGQGRVLLDPNTLRTDGTVALSGLSVSEDGNTLAYGLSQAGSDWQEWFVRDVSTGKDLSDKLENIKFSGASWSKDNKGFFYSRFPAPNESTKLEDANYNQKLYYHEIGKPQSEDKLIYERPDDKEMGIGAGVSEDGKFLMIIVSKGTAPRNLVYYKDLSKADAPVIPIVDKFEADYTFIGNDNANFYFRTDKDASRGKIVVTNAFARDARMWKDVVPEAKETLGGVDFINNQFVGNYLKDAYTQIRIYDLNGKLARNVELPAIGTAGGFGGKRFDTETFYTFTSFTTPPVIYRYDMKTGKSTIFKSPKVDFNAN